MRRISLVLSTLSVAIAFCAVLLAIGESQVSASGYPNAWCFATTVLGNLTPCACENSQGNTAYVYACAKSFEEGQMATLYYCLPGGIMYCTLGGTNCGQKWRCPDGNCNSGLRVCVPTPIPCDSGTTTGCSISPSSPPPNPPPVP